MRKKENFEYADTARRISWIDMAKGYGILLVIFGHLVIEPGIRGVIYSFHMPLFFFLSGHVFSGGRYTPGAFLRRKVKSLLIPYFALGIPVIGWEILTDYIKGFGSGREVLLVISGYLIQRRSTLLWFLACLFCLELLFFMLCRLCRDNLKVMGGISLISALSGILYYRSGGQPLPWNIDVCSIAVLFFFCGYAFKQHPELQRRFFEGSAAASLFLLAAANLMLTLAAYRMSGMGMDMYESRYGTAPLVLAAALAGIFFTLLLSYRWRPAMVETLGQRSLLYYAWHQIVILFLNEIFVAFGLFQSTVLTLPERFLRLLVYVCVIFAVLIPVESLIRHSRLKVITGL